MQFMMTNVKELRRLGIEEHELEKLNEATNDTDQDVQVVEILKHLGALTLFLLLEFKRGKRVLRQFWADSIRLDPDAVDMYYNKVLDARKMHKQLDDPCSSEYVNNSEFERLALITIRRIRYEANTARHQLFPQDRAKELIERDDELNKLLIPLFVVPDDFEPPEDRYIPMVK